MNTEEKLYMQSLSLNLIQASSNDINIVQLFTNKLDEKEIHQVRPYKINNFYLFYS